MPGDRIETIHYSRQFLKSSAKLPKDVLKQVAEKETIFKENPFALQLKTHKLHGKDKTAWAFWANYSYRIKFIFLSDKEVLFLDIGLHSIYK